MRKLREVAREMREKENWSISLQKEFCNIIGVLDEWEKADKKEKENIIFEYANQYNVDISYSPFVYVVCKRGWEINYLNELKRMDNKIKKQLYGKGYETEQEYYTAYENLYMKIYKDNDTIEIF